MSGTREHRIKVTRTARYYTIGDAASARQLWLVLHGYGQLAARFIRNFEPIATTERLIVAPEALLRFYLDPADRPAAQRRVGASWMTREDRETDIADYITYLDQVVTDASDARALEIFALGFSQGVATAARWALTTPHPIRELVLWGSLLPPDLDQAAARERLPRMRIRSIIGDYDEFADEKGIHAQAEWARGNQLNYQAIAFAGGHAIDAATLQAVAESVEPS